MSGRRKAERRVRDVVDGGSDHADPDTRSGVDRREFIRRMSDLTAEMETLARMGEREALMARVRAELVKRGVQA